ncbi:hypothetical protein A11A3_04184 [Alcanivorax hongdengensis A-11-3]|uniref:Uncharacterized protein n=1 Tax=Alcanivorax hongdengensis A-11-3 TaxID=1177179 RepID=L0WHC1_9GAMM|nr:DUF523 domain-containing protein [Alcanivorax hongdengensis]EKF75527.1 hypothetical protein A11A3_04184 [Alcanivorax hongdengensis A-11-3]
MLTDLLEKMGFALPRREMDKPLVGVSACLLGQPVRYDGGDRFNHLITNRLSDLLRFMPVCPEVAIGLPVPRPPIQVVQMGEGKRVRGVLEPERDFTDALEAVADELDAPLSGFLLKARSPSCGHLSTPVHDDNGQPIGMDSGAFARRLHQRYPRIALANESDLEKPAFVQEFLLQVFCYQQWHGSDQQGQWLQGMRERTHVLEEPLQTCTNHYLQRLSEAMH